MKLSQALEGFFLDKGLNFSAASITNYEGVFRKFIDYLGDIEFANITAIDVRRFLNDLHSKQGLSKHSVHTHWAVLSSFWTWAEKELEVKHVIRNRIPAPDFQKRTIKALTQDEVQRLVDVAAYTMPWKTRSGRKTRSKRPSGDRDRAIILVLVDTGIRATELCTLTVDDYDSKRGRLHIRHGKGDKERYVILGSRSRKAIWQYMVSREDARGDDPLFASRDGRQLDRNNLRHLLNRIAKHADVSSVHPHRFRHTFAIQFLRNGGNVLLLKELLVHETLEMVMNYVALAESDIDTADLYSPADRWRL